MFKEAGGPLKCQNVFSIIGKWALLVFFSFKDYVRKLISRFNYSALENCVTCVHPQPGLRR